MIINQQRDEVHSQPMLILCVEAENMSGFMLL